MNVIVNKNMIKNKNNNKNKNKNINKNINKNMNMNKNMNKKNNKNIIKSNNMNINNNNKNMSKNNNKHNQNTKYISPNRLLYPRGILDPEGKELNPLTDTEYQNLYSNINDRPGTYADFASKIWTTFPMYKIKEKTIESIYNNQVVLITF